MDVPDNVGDLQCAADMAGIQQQDLPVPQVRRALIGQSLVRIRSGGDHDDIHIAQSIRQNIRNEFRPSFAGDLAGELNGAALLQCLDLGRVVIVEFNGIPLAAQDRCHGLTAGAGAEYRKLQLVHKILLYE